MNLTCEQVGDLLGEYLDGELPPELHSAFEQHLNMCPNCFVAIRQYQATIRVTRALGRYRCDPLPSVVETRLRAVIAVHVARQQLPPDVGDPPSHQPTDAE